MKKAVLIKSNLTIQAVELTEPLYRSLGDAVGGCFETVRPAGLNPPYLMIVNESGVIDGLPRNEISCYLYHTFIHGHPIAGDIVIMREGPVGDGEYDLIGLDDYQTIQVIKTMQQVKKMVCSEVYRRGR